MYNKSLATLEKVNYLYDIDVGYSINELEKLKVLIRNEDIEPNILDSLAKLYVKDAKYYEGLSLLQEIHVNFSYYKDILKVNQEIQRLLIPLFSKEKINDISPLMLIDMFAKFKDFLPIGREGLDVSLNFADYLMRVNLVAEAASFLEHLIKYKLHGKEKS